MSVEVITDTSDAINHISFEIDTHEDHYLYKHCISFYKYSLRQYSFNSFFIIES
jgi:hypothetical protein